MARRVVVTGMGAVSPIGNDVATVSDALMNGVCGIGPITRFDITDYKVKIAAEVKDFQPATWIDPTEVRKMDLFSQYAMGAAVQAYEQAGLEDAVDPARFGVFVGSGIGGINTLCGEYDKLITSGPRKVSPFFIPMMIDNMAAGLISIRYKAQGPSMSIVTACATSTNAIGEAFRAIKHGYADVMMSGGSEAAINPISVAGFTNIMALTQRNDPMSSSIPFDKRRDGFVMGEGGVCLVLEEYEHAKARGAKILAEVVGYGSTSDAFHMTQPAAGGEIAARAMTLAMEEAGISPEQVGYINAHGTSTPPNDRMETMAIKVALGDYAYKTTVSSTKSMTGHMLGAAGAMEAVACIEALRRGTIPPTIGYAEPDPECDLDIVPNTARKLQVEYTLSNSIGFGGHNACIAFRKAD